MRQNSKEERILDVNKSGRVGGGGGEAGAGKEGRKKERKGKLIELKVLLRHGLEMERKICGSGGQSRGGTGGEGEGMEENEGEKEPTDGLYAASEPIWKRRK